VTVQPLRVGILGLGLIGSSVARGLQSWATVVAHDPDPEVRRAAAEAGIDVAEGADGVSDADVLLLAAPTRQNSRVLADLAAAGFARPVADLGSVKRPIEQVWLDTGASVRFVGTHPMAGSETAGFAAGAADLFEEAAWPVVVHPRTDPSALLAVLRIIVALGARPIPVSARAHDEAAALVSHLPHLLAGALGHAEPAGGHRQLSLSMAGGSFRDGSRVSASPPARSAEFLVLNGDAAAQAARAAARALTLAADALEGGDQAAVESWLDPGHQLRAAFVRRWTATSGRTVRGSAADLHDCLLGLSDTGAAVVWMRPESDSTWFMELAVPEAAVPDTAMPDRVGTDGARG
jgi:prephenate dehydrogenase